MSVKRRYFTIAAIAFAMLFPTLLTWVYFVLLENRGAAAQQSAYSVLKLIQFAFPLVFSWCWYRQTLPALIPGWRHPELLAGAASVIDAADGADRKETTGERLEKSKTPMPRTGWLVSVWFGLFVAASIFAGYWLLERTGWIEAAFLETVRQKVSGVNLDTPWRFVALGVFYALIHSYLEEYYWRWFVFIRLRDYLPDYLAIVLSSLGFMAHHVILLATFFGWGSPLTWLFSAGVAIGGVVWAWLYRHTGKLLYPWISHLIVDAALFALGYFLVFG